MAENPKKPLTSLDLCGIVFVPRKKGFIFYALIFERFVCVASLSNEGD